MVCNKFMAVPPRMGRTLRQFMLGVLLVPSVVSVLWMTVTGGSGLYQELYETSVLVEVVVAEQAWGSFALLEYFQVPRWLALASMTVLIVAVGLFFATSSDSGSLVIDILTSGGDPDPPTSTRVFWATFEGIVAAVLLTAGGLEALQSVATIVGLPVLLVILVMCLSLYRGLRDYTWEKPLNRVRG